MEIERSLDKNQKMKRDLTAFVVEQLLYRGGSASVSEFEGSIAIWDGIRQKTQDEYLEDMQHAGLVDVDNGTIRLKWDKEKTRNWLDRNKR